jgi:RNA polymerase sigma factor (sigma-70 family)
MDKTSGTKIEIPTQKETDRTKKESLFFDLYFANEKIYYNYIVSRIGKNDVNDILHSAILSGLKSFYRLKNECDFAQWFFGVVKNVIKEDRRNKTTYQNAIQQYRKTANLEKELIAVDDLEKKIMREEQMRIVCIVLDKLPENIRMAFRLHYETGMSFHKISEIFNVHENTIKMWVKRAKKQIIPYLEYVEKH